ncbi:unnamed protein product [Brassicogethes aeneus]|uniref:Tubulin polyglutamylase TTLL4 n=1 Tax=Brassicogethes aeneus TaxID=1431903 RepID=A0A9P0BI97_BRAAE|nr:unnamed protein product [Brassicogethes aeneus]
MKLEIIPNECSSDSEPEVDEGEQDGTSEQSNTDSEEKQIDKKCLNETGSGDANLIWPLRHSLFPHIPPYICFSSHDSPIPMKFPMGGKFFKWKLTTITPILVRQTLSNSGFSLVRTRGVGIKVINKWSQLPKKMSLVVQKYIPNPYLINGSKFDLRLYVLVTSFHPLRIYLYPDGLARFASAKYSDDSKDLKDRYRHLTNYSINKLSDQYTANEDANACQGHKWTLSKLMEYLEGKGVNSRSLWKNLQQLVIKTMISAEGPITQLCEENMNSIYNCYELFGVDVLLDVELKPWLLEVNISPSLHSASPLDAHVKGPMVQTLFDMAQFHIPSKATASNSTPSSFNPKLYTMSLTKNERLKHANYEEYVDRNDYLHEIVEQLNGDDVRQLARAEDEYAAKGRFERIFPTAHTHKYLEFMEPRYYNRLFDAWEAKYGSRRQEGINYLKTLCSQRIHLKTAASSKIRKNSLSMTPGDRKLQPSKEGQTLPLEEILRNTSIASEVLVCAN